MDWAWQWLAHLAPILVGILVFWIMRKSGSWNTWEKSQQRQVELLEQQNRLLEETNHLLRKIQSQR